MAVAYDERVVAACADEHILALIIAAKVEGRAGACACRIAGVDDAETWRPNGVDRIHERDAAGRAAEQNVGPKSAVKGVGAAIAVDRIAKQCAGQRLGSRSALNNIEAQKIIRHCQLPELRNCA